LIEFIVDILNFFIIGMIVLMSVISIITDW